MKVHFRQLNEFTYKQLDSQISVTLDTVDHNVLLDVLQQWFLVDGPALKWFRSFLTERTQMFLRRLITSSLLFFLSPAVWSKVPYWGQYTTTVCTVCLTGCDTTLYSTLHICTENTFKSCCNALRDKLNRPIKTRTKFLTQTICRRLANRSDSCYGLRSHFWFLVVWQSLTAVVLLSATE